MPVRSGLSLLLAAAALAAMPPLALSQTLRVAAVFSVEQPLAQAGVPQAVLAHLKSELEPIYGNAGCPSPLPRSLESSPIELTPGGSQSHLLVKPSSLCLCAVHTCPHWIFRGGSGRYELIGRIDAHTLSVLNGGDNRYRRLESFAGTAGWSDRTIWRFDGSAYVPGRCWVRE